MNGGSPSSYTPEAGDVVEFEYDWDGTIGTFKGVVYMQSGYDNPCVTSEFDHPGKYMMSEMTHESIKSVAKIGFIESVPASKYSGMSGIEAITRAYFAQEQAEPDGSNELEYKDGDLVEVCNEWEVRAIKEITAQGNYRTVRKCGETWVRRPSNIRPLSGTYAERQAKWVEFHGLKVGSKVKVIRGYEDDEDGCKAGRCQDGDGFFGDTGTITSIEARYIGFRGDHSCHHPYFALEPVAL